MASAASRTTCSFTSQWNRFQLFHPIGGVRARESEATAGLAAVTSPTSRNAAQTRGVDTLAALSPSWSAPTARAWRRP